MSALPLKHALITGASRGIGLSIAQLFAKHNYRCTLISRNADALSSAVSTLPQVQPPPPPTPNPSSPSPSNTPTHHTFIAADLSSPSIYTTPAFTAHFPRTAPRIDALINCAGLSQNRLFAATSEEEIQALVNTNLTTMMTGTRWFLRRGLMNVSRGRRGGEKENRDGGGGDGAAQQELPVIINMASLLGMKGGYGAVAYAAAKAGVLGFTRALAGEVGGEKGVRVNALVPGYVETGMTRGLDSPDLISKIPLRRFGTPDEVAHAALFLAQNQYAHNCVLNLDGGLSAT